MAADAPLTPMVFIALGANLGNPRAQIRLAVRRLGPFSAQPVRASSLWASTPVDCPEGSPEFVNAVAAVVPFLGETPESWLDRLQGLEREFGRPTKVVHNEPRCLDLDLIAWGQETRVTPRLTLPHPRARERRFVLAPMAELEPGFILPGETQTIAELLAAAAPDPALRRLDSE